MKKILLVFGLSIMITTGCLPTQPSTQKEDTSPPKPAQQESKTVPQKDENGVTVLDQVGQKTVAKDGVTQVELIKIKKVNEVVDMGPIKLLIKDIKIFQMSNIGTAFRQQLEKMENRTLPATVSYIQVQWEAENTTDKNVDFGGFNKVVLNTKEQFDMSTDLFSINPDFEYLGKVKQTGTLRKIFKADQKQVTNVKLATFGVFDNSTGNYEELKNEQIVEYKLD